VENKHTPKGRGSQRCGRTAKDPSSGKEKSDLIVAIDIERHRKTLDELEVRRENIIDRFVPAPQARNMPKDVTHLCNALQVQLRLACGQWTLGYREIPAFAELKK
jgi:hypothetical protein